MPLVGFGCAGLGRRGEEAVLHALRAGFRLVDTAQATEWYDEVAVGRAIRKSGVSRDEIFVTTKIHPKNFGYARTSASIEESLSALGLEQIDLLLLHTASCEQWGDICPPDPKGERGSYFDAWRALEDAYEQGKVRAIGVSNFNVNHLDTLLGHAETRHPVMVIQNWMDPLTKDEAVRKWADEHGALYTAYSTLGGQWQWRNAKGGNPVLTHPTIVRIAAKHNVSPVLTVLSWALQERVSIIPRSSQPRHIQELAEGLLPGADGVIRTFLVLDEDDMAAIRAMEADREANEESESESELEGGGVEEEL